MATLSLGILHRPGAHNVGSFGGSQTERFSFDFVIDGISLYDQVSGAASDLVGAPGWLPSKDNQHQIDQLLLRSPPPLPDRRMLFICPECGDIGCGAITCEVLCDDDSIVWQRFAFENDYEEPDFEPYREIGPFRFGLSEYQRTIEAAASARAPVRGSGSSSWPADIARPGRVHRRASLRQVVRDKRDREPSAGKAIAVDADAGFPDNIDMRELEGAIGYLNSKGWKPPLGRPGGGYSSSANS